MLEAEDVSVRVRGKLLLDRVSIQVAPGEVLAVVGPNGAGKSTLLRVLAGELRPTSGEVRLEGTALSAWPARELARRRAVLPQDAHAAFSFDVADIVLMGRIPHGRSPRDLSIASAALATVGIADLANRSYPTLSGGERQRVHLARALAQIWAPSPSAARYLLLDEPTSSLDLAHQHAVLSLARRLASEGVAVLAVLHDLNLAAQYAGRVAVLDRGSLVALGAPSEVLTADLLLTVFGVTAVVIRHPELGRPVFAAAASGT